jgi:xanthine dehydrogenase accessory factor
MWNWISELEKLREEGQPLVVVTVAGSTGSTPREVGAKMIVPLGAKFQGTIGGGHLEELALADAARCLDERESRVIRYPLGAKTGQCCGGTVDLLYEVVNCGPRLYLFGAGHVGQAVCRTLTGTLFQVHLIDERDEWVNSPEVPTGVIRHHCEWDEFIKDAYWNTKDTYVAVMTHRHDLDQQIIENVLDRPSRYIGLIGSRGKWERFKQRFEQRGITEDRYARVKCPLGLNLWGKAPQEVAISLGAELLKLHYENS